MKQSQHNRRSVRLRGYDYTQSGAYFVTICTYQRQYLFGHVSNGIMILNDCGIIVQQEWTQTAVSRVAVKLDAFVIMPNHVHGIVILDDDRSRGMAPHAPTTASETSRVFSRPVAGSLSTIVGAFKSAVTKHVRRVSGTPNMPMWQRGFHEHIIRDEASLNNLRAYIIDNPTNWAKDTLLNQTGNT